MATADDSDAEIIAVVRASANALADAIVDAIPGWAERSVRARIAPFREGSGGPDEGVDITDDQIDALAAHLDPVVADLRAEFDRFVATIGTGQRGTPLSLVRANLSPVLTRWLDARRVPRPDPRTVDGWVTEGDPYGFGPASFAELGDDVAERGIEWGAATALLHLRRRAADDG